MIKKNLSIAYKKSDGRLSHCRLNLTKDLVTILELTSEKRSIDLEFKNNFILLKRYKEKFEEVIEKSEEKLLYLHTLITASYEEKKNNFKMLIPLPIVKEWNLEKTKAIMIEKKDTNKVILEPLEESKMEDIKKKSNIESETKIYQSEGSVGALSIMEVTEEKKDGTVFTFKVEKGGIGKTFLTVQIGAGLALAGFRILIITSDPQNNIIGMALKSEIDKNEESSHYTTFDKKRVTIDNRTKGLKSWIRNETGEIIKLRENLDFIPLESPIDSGSISKEFKENLKKFIEIKKKEYDYILIDSIPTKKLDSEFLKYTDQIIVPAYGDKFTTEGVVEVIKSVGVDKVFAIIFNRYDGTATQKAYYNQIKEIIEQTDICFPLPIKQLSAISKMVERGKTIWESNDKKIIEIAKELQEVLIKIIQKTVA
ncbi:ParA family protein [Fusobacterium sp.]|uniref:ParA family protein n=1 Tax=Fusobacterium sp. TaxID=68766 RepID=UPI002901F13E|nr:ParA family protein [Fusobacterium sp.]MDU1912647.1 ParA family protein [Fusobacterium sp.]